MADLTELDRQIRERLCAAEQRRMRRQEVLRQRVEEDFNRARQFGKIADRLVHGAIRPRVRRLYSYFENAEFLPSDLVSRYNAVCRFEHTARFPASTTFALSISHGAHFEALLVHYDIEILPIPFQFERHGELAFSLDAVKEGVLEAWVEEKILYFVETYLRLGGDEFPSLLVERKCPVLAGETTVQGEIATADADIPLSRSVPSCLK